MLLGGPRVWVFPSGQRGPKPQASGALAVLISLGVSAGVRAGRPDVHSRWRLPLAIPLGALGGWLVVSREVVQIGAQAEASRCCCFCPRPRLTWDTQGPPPVVRSAHGDVTIAATPEQVWKHVVAFSEICPNPTEWYFRAGIAYPKRDPHRRIRPGRDTLLRVLHRPVRRAGRDLGRAAPAAIPRDGESRADARVEPLRRDPAQAFARILDYPGKASSG